MLFTDGASNSVPGDYPAAAGQPRALRTWDFPDNGADPDNQTHANPHIDGLYHTQTGVASPSYTLTTPWNSTQVIPQVPFLPVTSKHFFHRSGGIPDNFPLQTNALKVDGQPQNTRRGAEELQRRRRTSIRPRCGTSTTLRATSSKSSRMKRATTPPATISIRIFTIGMGELVRYDLGTRPEKSEDILKRIANDATSPDFNDDQLEGKYYFAQTEADVMTAFRLCRARSSA